VPLLDRERVADVVLPHTVDLEVAVGDALDTDLPLLHHPPAAVVPGNDGDLDAMQPYVVEREAGHRHQRLRHVAVTRLGLVDPVADVRRLEWPPLHRRQVDLPGEALLGAPAAPSPPAALAGIGRVDEDAEAEAGAELPLPLAGAAAHGEGLGGLHHVGQPGIAGRFPRGQPVGVATADLLPRREVGGDEGAQQDPPPDQLRHRCSAGCSISR
jgi:hypothetical protein